jgi:hypothetical protein
MTSTIKYILIGVILIVGFYLITKSGSSTTPLIDPVTGKPLPNPKIDPKTGLPIPTTPPVVSPFQDYKPVLKSCYDRPAGYVKYSNVGFPYLQNVINALQRKGWSSDKISYGAAFLKGMDLEISSHLFFAFENEIDNFKSGKPTIYRNESFDNEISGQRFAPGTLVCGDPRSYVKQESTTTTSGGGGGSTSVIEQQFMNPFI